MAADTTWREDLGGRVRRWAAAIWIGLVVLAPNPSRGLDPSRPLEEYTLATWSEGLPQQTLHAVVQTPDGYLWIGTYEGLVRFDGVRFKVFDRRNTPALASNSVLSLLVGTDGQLWIGTSEGVTRYRNRQFESVLGPEALGRDFVSALAEDHEGRVWAGASRRLIRVGDDGNEIYRSGVELPDSVVRSLLWDQQGYLWVGFESGEIARIENQVVNAVEVGPPGRAVLSIAQAPSGEIWIATEGAGVFRGEVGAWQQLTEADGLSTDYTRTVLVDRRNTVWIATEGGGLNRYRNAAFEQLDSRRGLASDLVRSLWEDQEGSLWVGTNGGGLHVLQDRKFAAYTEEDGLSNGNIRAVLEDRDGAIWLGTDGGGLNRLLDGRLEVFTEADGLGNDFVKALHQDAAGTLWVGTTGGGLSRWVEGRFETLTSEDGLPADIVYSILEDRQGRLWIATNRGLARLDPDGSITTLRAADGLANENVTALLEASNGDLWIGTLGGLQRLRDGILTLFTDADGLASLRVFSLYEDASGLLWVGTDRGLTRHRKGQLDSYTTEDGLFDDRIFSILEDDEGYLWMTSNKGVGRVARADLDRLDRGEIERVTSQVFGRSDGLPASQCNGVSQPAAWRARDGRLWFATVRGAGVVDPRRLRPNPNPPPVEIEAVIVDDRELSLPERSRLDPGSENVEIHYTALTYMSPDKVRFRYRLEGFDRTWVEAGNRRVAYYTRLPPGDYRFRVLAANEDGVWNEEGASIQVVAVPHWYETTATRLAAVLLVLGGFWLGHRYRLAWLRRRHGELERQVLERTAELATANRQLEALSLRDGLTGVANRRRFDAWLQREWNRASRDRSPLALLMVDIDFFKQFNDRYGHPEGDECLRNVASVIDGSARRATELVARYGGEEFAVILPGATSEEAAGFGEVLRSRVAELRVPHEDSAISSHLTISVGVAAGIPPAGASAADLVSRADQALYAAKSQGRDQVVEYSSLVPPTPDPGPA